MTLLADKKRLLELKQYELNVLKLETRLLELDEEKIRIQENIKEQKSKLKELEDTEE